MTIEEIREELNRRIRHYNARVDALNRCPDKKPSQDLQLLAANAALDELLELNEAFFPEG